MNVVEEKWPDIIEHLRVEHELSNISFSTWIQPLKVFNVIDNTVYILVKMNASVDYIEKKYSLPLKVCIAEITGIEYNIIFLSEDDERMDELKKISIQSTKGKMNLHMPLHWQFLNLQEKYIILFSYMEEWDWAKLI